MRFLTGLLLAVTLLCLVSCESKMRESRSADSAPANAAAQKAYNAPPEVPASSLPKFSVAARPAPSRVAEESGGGGGRHGDSITDDASAVSLASIGTVYAATEAVDRKIIRNGELTLETESPTEGLRKITAAAESHGGFVVTSEFKQNPVAAGAKPSQSVTVVARVPASQFASALDQIRNAGERVIQEKVSGQDVSEEYLDVEARLRNKKALEGQFLEIMKQARKVADALDVQSQLADVRTEIERLE